MQIRIALPKGRLLAETAAALMEAGWGLDGYQEGVRLYRLQSQSFPGLQAKMFHERDIPVQVAIGNYDLGICGLDWVEELLSRYKNSALVKVRNLGYGKGVLYLAVSRSGAVPVIEDMRNREETIRIASEYPNLAESFAVGLRLRRFSIFPLWGAAEVYPPDTADLALVSERAGVQLNHNLMPVSKVLNFSAFLIANQRSWERKDMSSLLASIEGKLPAMRKDASAESKATLSQTGDGYFSGNTADDVVRLALPDGHQQKHTARLLGKAGIRVDDYPSANGNRRPAINVDGVAVKVIRPQDMPLQVANGNFDLAITGRDWLAEHVSQFPSSPARKLLDLKLGKVRVVAVVSKELAVEDIDSLRRLCVERAMPVRVASEYVNIADKYARDNHLGVYKIVPTWGATEAFLPEDADLLIENTESGSTIARHNLRIIDTLFESTACLVGRAGKPASVGKQEKMNFIVEALRVAVEDM